MKSLTWTKTFLMDGDDILHAAMLPNCGRITVLDRLTGYSDYIRDTETGYKDESGRFWLASGMQDVRDYPEFTIPEAIEWIKTHANTCISK